jgi:hypothetical protein
MEKFSGMAIDARKKRIDFCHGILKSAGRVEYPRAIALIQFNLGVSEAKAREYIRVLKDMLIIKVEKGFVMA